MRLTRDKKGNTTTGPASPIRGEAPPDTTTSSSSAAAAAAGGPSATVVQLQQQQQSQQQHRRSTAASSRNSPVEILLDTRRALSRDPSAEPVDAVGDHGAGTGPASSFGTAPQSAARLPARAQERPSTPVDPARLVVEDALHPAASPVDGEADGYGSASPDAVQSPPSFTNRGPGGGGADGFFDDEDDEDAENMDSGFELIEGASATSPYDNTRSRGSAIVGGGASASPRGTLAHNASVTPRRGGSVESAHHGTAPLHGQGVYFGGGAGAVSGGGALPPLAATGSSALSGVAASSSGGGREIVGSGAGGGGFGSLTSSAMGVSGRTPQRTPATGGSPRSSASATAAGARAFPVSPSVAGSAAIGLPLAASMAAVASAQHHHQQPQQAAGGGGASNSLSGMRSPSRVRGNRGGNSPQAPHHHISAVSSSFRRFGAGAVATPGVGAGSGPSGVGTPSAAASGGGGGVVTTVGAAAAAASQFLSIDAALSQTVSLAQKAALGCAALAVLLTCAGGACVAGVVAGATSVALVRTWALWGDLPTNAAVPLRLDFTSGAAHHIGRRRHAHGGAGGASHAPPLLVGPLGVGWVPIGSEERANEESQVLDDALIAAACYCAFPSSTHGADHGDGVPLNKEGSTNNGGSSNNVDSNDDAHLRSRACKYASAGFLGNGDFFASSAALSLVPPEPFGPIALPTSHELPAFTLAPNSVYDVELDLTLPDPRHLYPPGSLTPRVGGLVTARVDVIGLAHPSDCDALTPPQSDSAWWPFWGGGEINKATASDRSRAWVPPPASAVPAPIVLASAATSAAIVAEDDGLIPSLLRDLMRLPFRLFFAPAPAELDGRTIRLSLLHRFAPTPSLMKRARYLRVTILPPAAAQPFPRTMARVENNEDDGVGKKSSAARQEKQPLPQPFAVLGTPTLHVRGETRSTVIWLLQRHPFLTAAAIFVPVFLGTAILGVVVLSAVLMFVVSSFMSR